MNDQIMGIVSLVLLVGTILLGIFRKKNLGILAIGAAFLFGFFLHSDTGTLSGASGRGSLITSLFPFQIFWQTLSVSLMLNVGSVNGTFQLIIRKLVGLARGRRALIPIVVFLAMMLVCSAGAGSTGIVVLLCTIAANIARDEDISPVFMLLAVLCGATVGVGSPVASIGIICNGFSMDTWGEQIAPSYMYPRAAALATFTFGAVYVLFRGWKLERRPVNREEIRQKLNGKQWLTVAGMILFIILSIVCKLEMGLSAFLVTGLYLLLECADEKQVIAEVPWSSLLLICGMCILIGVVKYAGGMDLLTESLKKLMNAYTVKPIYSILGSLLSMVSSVTGVVLPGLLPTVPEVAVTTGINPYALITALAYGSNIACVSPISSMGAIAMGIMGTNAKWDAGKLFKEMLKYSFILMLVAALWAAIGIAG